jgi:redox-sensitive bicupin YhaK (pirin superfamily)
MEDMNRRDALKGTAILGAAALVPRLAFGESGLMQDKGYRKVHAVLSAGRSMVGTLPILRAFAGDRDDYVSPYVMLDEFGPVNLNTGAQPLRVDAHPHAGVTPTTFFLSGSGHHRDSLNFDFQIGKGDFMLFHSGRGAIHMEETGKQLYDEGGMYHGFQIWLNMPSRYKFIAPSTRLFGSKDYGYIKTEQYEIMVILGELAGQKSAIETFSPAFYYYIKAGAGARIEFPVDALHNAFIYLVRGEVETEGRVKAGAHQLVLFERGAEALRVFVQQDAEFVLLGGEPLKEHLFAYGPFVMNTEDQIRQCIRDYQTGKMGDPDVVNGRK